MRRSPPRRPHSGVRGGLIELSGRVQKDRGCGAGDGAHRWLSIIFEIVSLVVLPTICSLTAPSLNSKRVGMPLMLYLPEIRVFSSTFSFTTRPRPLYFSAIASTPGASIRHGAHQAAQKSTRTGSEAFSTS